MLCLLVMSAVLVPLITGGNSAWTSVYESISGLPETEDTAVPPAD